MTSELNPAVGRACAEAQGRMGLQGATRHAGWAEGEQGGAGAGAWAGDPTILGVMGCTKGLGKPLPPHYTQRDKGVEGAE